MMDALRAFQLDFMLILTGICGLILFLSISIKNLSTKSRTTFIMVNFCATILILADRFAYIYRGDQSEVGFWMVRITNFLTYLMIITVLYYYTKLIKNILIEGGMVTKRIKRMLVIDICCGVDVLLLVVSQFFGLLYTFDELNQYQRSPLNWISYILPLTVMILQLSIVIQYWKSIPRKLFYVLVLFDVLPIFASVVQVYVYGLSLANMAVVILVILLYFIALNDMNQMAEKSGTLEMEHLRDQQARMERLLDQTATSLIDALDAKEKYTQGHSRRVAKYARELARLAGKDEKELYEIYYAALLHDIGKIGIPDEIINKKGKLTSEEYEIMKQHPVLGREILSGITGMPYLAIGANFHHERYDGTGYPEGLKGEEIPELGRILAVADAYDAMSSMRSYRDAIPQQKIREEFIKHSGTQFDPDYAKLMQHLIDLDSEYQMKEMTETGESSDKTSIECRMYREEISEGILINTNPTTIQMVCIPTEKGGMPSFVLFDSLDAMVHKEESMINELNYFEYATIRFDGETEVIGARTSKTVLSDSGFHRDPEEGEEIGTRYEIVASRYKDHALFTIQSETQTVTVTIALPDNTRFMYVGITGENCRIRDIRTQKSENTIGENYIPRIAEEISFIKGPEGDVPNVQIDGYRTDATEGIPIRDGMEINFHTMSLPTARLVWHTAFIDIFSSDNKKVDGPNHKEYALIRLDGEYWEDSGGIAENLMDIKKTDDFVDWDAWKELNKNGMDVRIRFEREGNTITTITENAGISIRNITTLKEMPNEVYVTLTGDQVALTEIRIINN